MTPDELFDPIDTDPSIPDKLVDRTLKYLPDLVRVDVERKRGTNSWKKVNGFKIDTEPSGEHEAEVEKVCAMIVMIAQADHEEHGDEQHYRAKYHVRNKKGQIQRKTFAFKLTDESDEPEPTLDNLEQQEVLAVAFDRAIALIDVQTRHIDNLNAQMLSQAQTQAGQTAPLLQTIETLVNTYRDGLAMQVNSVMAVAEMERSSKEAEFKAERDRALIDLLAAAMPAFAAQLGGFFGKKKDEEQTEAEQGAEPQAREQPRPRPQQAPHLAPHQRAQSQGKPEPEPEPEKTVPEKPKHPLTMFAHAFRDSIQSEQWLALSEVLTKAQVKLLKEATTADNDSDTAAGILEFKDSLKPTLYLKLNRILDPEQREMIMKLLEVIDDYTDQEDEGEEEDTDEEEEEEGEEEEVE
jgi:hypothetical protein